MSFRTQGTVIRTSNNLSLSEYLKPENHRKYAKKKRGCSGVGIWLFFFFPFEINSVSCRDEDCLTPQFTDTDREEEAPAEHDWVLVNALNELWHQKYDHLWLKLKAEQMKTYFTFQVSPNTIWVNRNVQVPSKPLVKLRHQWHECCKSDLRKWTGVVLSFL